MPGPGTESAEHVTPQAGGWVNAAVAVAVGQTGSAAAAAGGVSLHTLRRWSHRPAFRQLVERIRADLISSTLGRLLDANGAAVDALRGLLASPVETVRLGAAGRLLELTLRARKQLDTEAQFEEVRELIGGLKRQQPEPFPRPIVTGPASSRGW